MALGADRCSTLRSDSALGLAAAVQAGLGNIFCRLVAFAAGPQEQVNTLRWTQVVLIQLREGWPSPRMA